MVLADFPAVLLDVKVIPVAPTAVVFKQLACLLLVVEPISTVWVVCVAFATAVQG